MNFTQRLITRLRRFRFEDYEIQTGHTNVGKTPRASYEEPIPDVLQRLAAEAD